jgi:RND family efflux transporter MFP subunit
MKQKKGIGGRIITIVAILAIVSLTAFKLMSNKKKIDESNKPVDRTNIPIAVSVDTARILSVSGDFTLPAVLEPAKDADIAVAVQGKINSLNIEEGSYVAQGQVIGKIDSRLKELNLQSTQLSASKLEKDMKTYKELMEGNATTEEKYNDIKYNYENNRIQMEQIRQQIADGNIIAPISGVIVTKNLEAGEFVNPGTVIASIVSVASLKAAVMVNEKDVYKLKNGQQAVVSSDVFPGKTFRGQISFISPKGDDNHNYRVEVEVANAGQALKAGTYVKVMFGLSQQSDALQIPKKALAEGMKNPFIYVVKGNGVEQRKLVLGRELGENVEVIGGLQQGEIVVVNGQINLTESSKVEVVKN